MFFFFFEDSRCGVPGDVDFGRKGVQLLQQEGLVSDEAREVVGRHELLHAPVGGGGGLFLGTLIEHANMSDFIDLNSIKHRTNEHE